MSAVHAPLVPSLAPSLTETRSRTIAYSAAVVVVGVAVIALAARVTIPMWPVPITGQTLPVLLLGFAVGPRLAVATTGAYLGVAALGAPVLALNSEGTYATTDLLALTSGGYVVGFLVAGLIVGMLGQRAWHRSPRLVVAGMVLGNLAIYAIGVPWLMAVIGVDLLTALDLGAVPFLVGDAIKIAIAAALLPALSRLAGRARGDAAV